jgi:hypothetical protein
MLVMNRRRVLLLASLLSLALPLATSAQQDASRVVVPLLVPPGTPLRVQVDSTSFPKRVGDVVHAKLTQPIYAFDKEVVPAGTPVTGRIVGFSEASRMQRFQSILGGHFGSFEKPEVKFDTLLPAGEPPRPIATETAPSNGQIVEMRAGTAQKHGMIGSAVSKGKQEIQTQIKTAKSFLKSEHKTEVLRDAALNFLPYQPARITNGSTFDAVLSTPQNFGSEQVPAGELLKLGQSTPEDGTTKANLVTGLDSAHTVAGSAVEATLTAPLFAPDHTLLLPEGTRLLGSTSVARPARHLHRNGQLRFSFLQVELPKEIADIQKRLSTDTAEKKETKIRAGITGLTTRKGSHVAVDDEGTPKIEESKARFLGPAISVALVAAANSQEQEHGRVENPTGAQAGAGAIGLGLAGLIIGRYSHVGALALGSYGAARSVYSQFLGKGFDIQIPSNTLLLIQFGRTGNTLPKSSE